MATVLDNSLPVSMIRRHKGMISVVRRNVMVGEEFPPGPAPFGVPLGLTETAEEGSFLTSAPMTPSEVSRRYSNGRDLLVVFKKGYRKRGICAVSLR